MYALLISHILILWISKINLTMQTIIIIIISYMIEE